MLLSQQHWGFVGREWWLGPPPRLLPHVSPGLSEGAGKARQAHWAFSTAAAVRSCPTPGCRRWRCRQAQGAPLFQQYPVEQTGGVRGARVGHGSCWTSLDFLSPLPVAQSRPISSVTLGRRRRGRCPPPPLSTTLGRCRNHHHCPEGPGRPPASSGDPFWSLLRGRDKESSAGWAARTPPPICSPPTSQQLSVP